jgi:hypothetical protein
MADGAEDTLPPSSVVVTPPHTLVLLVFGPMPVDLRARCACVCRGWNAALSERALWTRLDVSRTSGVTARATDALLRGAAAHAAKVRAMDALLYGAAARAGGALRALDISGYKTSQIGMTPLCVVAAANAATLRQLRVCDGVCNFDANLLSLYNVKELLRAAPALLALDADLDCFGVAEARTALRADGVLAPLRVHGLRVGAAHATEADVLALAADVADHAWLQQLHVCYVPRAALDAFVDAALGRRLTAVQFENCGLSAAAAPALARLLGSSALTELLVWGVADRDPLVDAPAATLLADALRANSTLTTLQLGGVHLWRDAAAATTLLGALTAHPSLRTLSLRQNQVKYLDEAARVPAGASLAALLSANAPALTELNLGFCNLGDAGMAPLLEALPANTHLRTLACSSNDITEAFAADLLLPAVRANVSLRALDVSNWTGTHPGAREAKELVSRRV